MVNDSLSMFGYFDFMKPNIENDDEKVKIIVKILKVCEPIHDEDRYEGKIDECIANILELC